MQEGSFRCDVNISIRPKGDTKLYTRAEIKNLNSFKFIEKAIAYEYQRHVEAWEDGLYDKEVIQETRLFDTDKGVTKSMRGKEEAMDYRYFPDPDIRPISLLPEMYEKAKDICEMPREKELRYINNLGIKEEEVGRLVGDVDTNKVFESLIFEGIKPEEIKTIISILMVEVQAYLKDKDFNIKKLPISLNQLKDICSFVNQSIISLANAKKVLTYVLEEQLEEVELFKTFEKENSLIKIDNVLDKLNLKQVSNERDILIVVQKVLENSKEQVEEYKKGKEKLFGSFIGKVMKETGGKANPQIVNKLLKEELGK